MSYACPETSTRGVVICHAPFLLLSVVIVLFPSFSCKLFVLPKL